MSQSSTRNNFTDILLDPTTIAVVGSIAIHAILAANLALLTQPSKEAKKPDPGTVKVVELTPAELQRIPQAPPPIAAAPNPAQQVLPPIYQPTTPVPPPSTPTTPEVVASAPETIPLSPTPVKASPQVIPKSPVVRTPPKKKVITKPRAGIKDQKAVAQPQPAAPDFDSNISFKPAPTQNPPPAKPEVVTKPSPAATQPPKKKPTTPNTTKPTTTTPSDDGGDGDDTKRGVEPSTPVKVGENPTPTPTDAPKSPSSSSPPTEEPSNVGSDEQRNKAIAKLAEWQKKYPKLKIYPSKSLTRKYPEGTTCPKLKQPPFIVYKVVFDRVSDNKDTDITGEVGSTLIDTSVIGDKKTSEQAKLSNLAIETAVNEANEAEKSRPVADKDREVLYQYRVQFDPKSCKN